MKKKNLSNKEKMEILGISQKEIDSKKKILGHDKIYGSEIELEIDLPKIDISILELNEDIFSEWVSDTAEKVAKSLFCLRDSYLKYKEEYKDSKPQQQSSYELHNYSGAYYDEDYCSRCEERGAYTVYWTRPLMETNSQVLNRLLTEKRGEEKRLRAMKLTEQDEKKMLKQLMKKYPEEVSNGN